MDDDGSGTASIAAILQSVGNDNFYHVLDMGFYSNFKGKFSKARKQLGALSLTTISDVKEDPDQDVKGAIK